MKVKKEGQWQEKSPKVIANGTPPYLYQHSANVQFHVGLFLTKSNSFRLSQLIYNMVTEIKIFIFVMVFLLTPFGWKLFPPISWII